MRFPQAYPPEQDEVGFGLDKLEMEMMLHLEAVNTRGPVPAELLQGFDDGEARQPDATLGGAILPQIDLAFQESGQVRYMRPRVLGCLSRQRGIVLRDKGQFQIGQMGLHSARGCGGRGRVRACRHGMRSYVSGCWGSGIA